MRRINRATLTLGIVSLELLLIILALFAPGEGWPAWYGSGQLLLAGLAIAAALIHHLHSYATWLLVGVVVILSISLVGFYGHSQPAGPGYSYFSGGSWDTYAKDHSIKTAVVSVLSDPAAFITVTFAECDEYRAYVPQDRCSESQYPLGAAFASLLFLGSVAIGFVAQKKRAITQ